MSKKTFKFSKIEINNLIDDYNKFKRATTKRYSLSNEILYKLCEEHIKHDTEEEIEAKLLLIGRTYAASIERRKTNETIEYNDGDFIYDHIMNIFIDENGITNFAKELDSIISELNKSNQFDKENVDKLLRIHKELINATYTYTENEKRSLYSKYLHFHCPNAAYMYDSRTTAAITKFVYKQESIVFQDGELLEYDDAYDKDYFEFLARIAILKTIFKSWTPREIDNFLLWYADNILNSKSEEE